MKSSCVTDNDLDYDFDSLSFPTSYNPRNRQQREDAPTKSVYEIFEYTTYNIQDFRFGFNVKSNFYSVAVYYRGEGVCGRGGDPVCVSCLDI